MIIRIRTGIAARKAAIYTRRYGRNPGAKANVVMIIPPISGAIVRPTRVAEE